MTANNDALAVALDAIDRGYSPVPVPVGKKPNLKNWPKLRVTAETASRYFNGARVIAVEAPTFAFSAFKMAEYYFPNGLDGDEVKGRDPVSSAPVPEFMRAIVLPTNYGKGALRLLQMCIEYYVGTELPPDPLYVTVTGINSVIKQDQADTWFLQPSVFRLDESQRKEIDAGKCFLWVYGFVGYIGLLKDRRIVGFAVRWNHQHGIFIAGGPSAYSYDKQA